MSRTYQPLWSHVCYMTNWVYCRNIQIIDYPTSKKVNQRIDTLLETLFPHWSASNKEKIKNYTVVAQRLSTTLEGLNDDEDD